jgi:pyridoxine kinase
LAILSLQSHVVYGHVGNQAAVFPLQRLGHEVWPLDSLQYAAHAGYGPPRGAVTAAEALAEIVEGLDSLGVLPRCEALLSGYLGSSGQASVLADLADRLKAANRGLFYALDPVIGDREPGLYVRETLAGAIRDSLVPRADLVVPNHFELEWLAGTAAATAGEIVAAARRLITRGPREVYVTSVSEPGSGAEEIALFAVTAEAAWQVATPRLDFATPPNGAGDLISALILAHRLAGRPPEAALAEATAAVFAVLAATQAAGGRELALVAAQDQLVAPSRRFTARRIA